MLLVKTYLAPSKIHGIGCFAAEDIKDGTKVWEFQPIFDRAYSRYDLETMPENARLHALLRGYWDGSVLVVPIDNAGFFNHSFQPNVGENDLALRDIYKDEEILQDYRKFDLREQLFTRESK